MHAVAEDATLCVVSRFDELQRFSCGKYFVFASFQPCQIFPGQVAGAFVVPDQLRNGGATVASDHREYLFGDREDVTSQLVRKPIIEDADFIGARCVALGQYRSSGLLQVIFSLLERTDELNAGTALADIWLQ